ncbi:MAG: SBBP repeat-containing protein [Planctomycetes bacterium]|nr:SBBP repeat-containing protein [Planctomycetota bacterium]
MWRRLFLPVAVVVAAGVARAQESAAPAASPAPSGAVQAAFGKLPLYFVENRGLYPEEVKYYVRGADKTLFFAPDGITFRLKGEDGAWAVKLEFVGSNADVAPRGEARQQAVFSYFKRPKKDWKTGLRTFAKVVYPDLWPGIDLVYSGTVSQLKYEFVVAPGADPAQIRLRYRGADSVGITEGGMLRVTTPAGSFEDAAPVAWQEVGGERVPVEMAYWLDPDAASDAAEFGFRLDDYDPAQPLVLDPAVLLYCGYLGGSGTEYPASIAVDADGNAYVTGYTGSTEQTFPVTVGPDLTWSADYDAFVAKVNAAGTALLYCGYLGGSGMDAGYRIAVDGAGNAYVTGFTGSTAQTFPVTVGPDLTHNGGSDAFVAKVNAAGTALLYCGYVGGSGGEYGSSIAVDAAGNAYLAGYTTSTEQTFPVAVGPDLTYNGSTFGDTFVAKVNAAGTALLYCGYVGGSSTDYGSGIAVDGAGNAYVTGYTVSTAQTFPVTVGPDLTYNGGSHDAFVAKVNAAGTTLLYCGYLGGNGDECGLGIAVDTAGNAYVTGYTGSTAQTFPVAVGPDLTFNGGLDAFVAKVNAAGTALLYCGYLGGSGDDYGCGIAVDAAGNAYLAGYTDSTAQTFPVAVGPDLTYNGVCDAFMTKVNAAGTALEYCGYLGGSGADWGHGIAVDAAGNAYLTGDTLSTEQTFPVTVGPDLTHNGGYDAFVAKIASTLLVGRGAPRPGGQVNLSLASSGDAGLVYQLASSLGNGPIAIDTRRIELSPDPLLFLTILGALPGVFPNCAGVLDAQGQAQAAIHIPNVPSVKGIRIYTAFVTLRATAPSGVANISNTFLFTIQ